MSGEHRAVADVQLPNYSNVANEKLPSVLQRPIKSPALALEEDAYVLPDNLAGQASRVRVSTLLAAFVNLLQSIVYR